MFIISAALTLGTCIWFSRTNYAVHNSYWKFGFISLFLYGYGINMFFNISILVVIQNTPLHLQGVVNGIYLACSQILLSIGNALVPSITGNLQIAETLEMKHVLHDKFQTIFYVIMGFHVASLLIMAFFINTKKKDVAQDEHEMDKPRNHSTDDTALEQ